MVCSLVFFIFFISTRKFKLTWKTKTELARGFKQYSLSVIGIRTPSRRASVCESAIWKISLSYFPLFERVRKMLQRFIDDISIRVLVEHIEWNCSLKSMLQKNSMCFIRIRSRKWDIKPFVPVWRWLLCTCYLFPLSNYEMPPKRPHLPVSMYLARSTLK